MPLFLRYNRATTRPAFCTKFAYMKNYFGVQVDVLVPAFLGSYQWRKYRVLHQAGFDENATPANEDDLAITLEPVGRPIWPMPTIITVPRKAFENSFFIKIPPRH